MTGRARASRWWIGIVNEYSPQESGVTCCVGKSVTSDAISCSQNMTRHLSPCCNTVMARIATGCYRGRMSKYCAQKCRVAIGCDLSVALVTWRRGQHMKCRFTSCTDSVVTSRANTYGSGMCICSPKETYVIRVAITALRASHNMKRGLSLYTRELPGMAG